MSQCKPQKKQEILQGKYAKDIYCKEWLREDKWRLQRYRELYG